jgi:predicted ABC-type sugar transport system permease subunit
LGISSFWQTVIRGIVIILAVILDQLENNGPGRSSVKKAVKAKG